MSTEEWIDKLEQLILDEDELVISYFVYNEHISVLHTISFTAFLHFRCSFEYKQAHLF